MEGSYKEVLVLGSEAGVEWSHVRYSQPYDNYILSRAVLSVGNNCPNER